MNKHTNIYSAQVQPQTYIHTHIYTDTHTDKTTHTHTHTHSHTHTHAYTCAHPLFWRLSDYFFLYFSTQSEKLQKVVTKVKEESSKAGLDMNVKKTKVMIISKEPTGKAVEIKVNDETLEQVDTFKYLGTQIKDDLMTDKEVETRENLAKSKFCSIYKVLTSKRLKMSTRLNILNCYVFSIYCYGCEAWTLNKVLERKIDVFEMWCLRMMGKFKWSDLISNEKVLNTLKTKRSLLSKIQKRKLKYYGHIKRKDNISSQLSWRGKWKENAQKVDQGTPGSVTLRNGQGGREGSAPEWLLTGTCGVSSRVNLRREDDTSR